MIIFEHFCVKLGAKCSKDFSDGFCGKYINRSANVKRLCRYCNTPYDETDNTGYKFEHNRCDQVNILIEAANFSMSKESKEKSIEKLRKMSQHPVENAWKDINFCDKKRGIFGATPAEVMHCLQHGLFMYLFKGIFLQRKLNKSGRKRSLLKTAKSKSKKI